MKLFSKWHISSCNSPLQDSTRDGTTLSVEHTHHSGSSFAWWRMNNACLRPQWLVWEEEKHLPQGEGNGELSRDISQGCRRNTTTVFEPCHVTGMQYSMWLNLTCDSSSEAVFPTIFMLSIWVTEGRWGKHYAFSDLSTPNLVNVEFSICYIECR